MIEVLKILSEQELIETNFSFRMRESLRLTLGTSATAGVSL